jgi:hypothetical protein
VQAQKAKNAMEKSAADFSKLTTEEYYDALLKLDKEDITDNASLLAIA